MAFNLINFKKGTLAGLNTLKTKNGIEEGTFYLTIDENKQTSRLYIGTGAATALPVNSNIITVSTTDDLEESTSSGYQNPNLFNDGDFAYVTNGNILAVKKDGRWVQVNGIDDTKIWKDFTPTITTSNGTATISWALRNEADQVLKDSDGATPAITMTGANGITVSSTGKAVTVTGTAYEMSSAVATPGEDGVATIKLQNKSSADGTLSDVSSVAINAGTNVEVTGTANNITISAIDTTLKSDSVQITNGSTSGFNVAVTDSGNNGGSATLDPKITLGDHTAAADQISFVSGVANLPVYTKSEVDGILADVNGMVYRGSVGPDQTFSTLPTTGVKVGDTFKAGDDLSSVPVAGGGTKSVKTGDLLIANSSATPKETNGEIPAGSLYFEVIPSGDEIISYKGLGAAHTGNGVQIEDGAGTVLASMEVAAGNQMAVSSTHTGTNGEKAVVTVAHGTISSSTNGDANTPTAVSQEQIAHQTKTFDVVTGLTTNNGHVTGTTVERIQVTDTVSKLDEINTKTTVTTANNASTVKNTVALIDEGNTAINSKDLEFILRSDNLSITSTGSTITANYVWGQF